MYNEKAVNSTAETVENLRQQIKFKDMFQAQVREADIGISMMLQDLFENTLQKLSNNITKDGFKLAAQLWVEEDYRAEKNSIGYEVRVSFIWEPTSIDEEFLFEDVHFSKEIKTRINLALREFSKAISIPVAMA